MERVVKFLEYEEIFSLKQKGNKKKSYGCKDQLLIKKLIMENCLYCILTSDPAGLLK